MLTLPNILTLSRIVAVPLLAFLLWWPGWQLGYALAFGMIVITGIANGVYIWLRQRAERWVK